MKLGFLLVDVQYDFLHRAGLTPDANALEKALVRLLAAFRDQGLPVFHSYTIIKKDGSNAMPHWRAARQPMPCIEGSDGAQAPQTLTPVPPEKIFRKQFYSAFEDPQLLVDIQDAGVDTLVIAGLYTHACIRDSILAAYERGLKILLPVDGVASYDAEHARLTLAFLQDRAATCLTTDDIIAAVKHCSAKYSSLPDNLSAVKANTWLQRNPSNTDDVISDVVLADKYAVQAAAEGIMQAQKSWSAISLQTRREMLLQWFNHIQSKRLFWIESLIREVGKPRRDAESEVNYGLSLLQYTCETMIEEVRSQASHSIVHCPHGVVGLITPWNNPFAIPLGKIVAGLAYGNGIVWKPALAGSALSKALHQTLVDSNLGHLVTLVTGDAQTGQAVVECDIIHALSFTGATTVGQSLARQCASNNKVFQAELGGNNAAIVLADVEQSVVAQDLAQAMFSFSGQRCTAIRRVIVEKTIFESFKLELKAAVLALSVGEPSLNETDVGPVISKEVQAGLLQQIEQAKKRGAAILTGGFIPPQISQAGCWIMPTVITDLPADSAIIHQELFGPVVALQCADHIEEAIALNNGVAHGLLSALYTHSESAKKQFLSNAQAGILTINQARPAFNNHLPFGGWKASGIGLPEHGIWDKAFYTKPQAVYHKH